jgi:hypothetical protein
VFSHYLDSYDARLTSHQHGQPLKVIDMGETALDEQIFEEYLAEMRDHYTADKVYFILPRPFPRSPHPVVSYLG